jgi:catechol 2,3-dioxygenase-like lactoylglutathione lyase family enzyme
MGQITLATPDPEGSARDLAEIVGLKITRGEADAYFLSSNERSFEVVYARSSQPGILAVGLEAMNADAVGEVFRRVRAEGLEVIDDRPIWPEIAHGFRFRTPFGPIFEIHTPVPRDQATRHIGTGSRPRRLEHVNVRVADTHGFRDLLTGVLGLKISDRTTNDELAWYRAWDGYHHTIAVGLGSDLHHYAFDANAIDDLVGIADTLALKDRTLLWGPGRHGAGDNIFTYYLDPNGCAVETSVGMARIDNDDLYEPRTWSLGPNSKVRNLWGSLSSPEFAKAGVPFIERISP